MRLTDSESPCVWARSCFNGYERARTNYDDLKTRLDFLTGNKGTDVPTRSSSKPLPISMLGAGGALVAAGAYLGDSTLILGIASGAALFCVATYLLVTRRQGKKGISSESIILSKQIDGAKSNAEVARLSLVEAADPLTIDNLTDSALDAVEAHLSHSEKILSSWNEAHGRVIDAQRALKSQELKTNEASKKAKTSSESESKTQSQWLDWLGQQGLSDTLIPDTVIELIGRIKATRSILKQVNDMEQRIRNSSGDIEDYLALVQQLAGICDPFA